MKTLRNTLLSTLLIASITVFAQEKQNIDIIKTTKLEKAKFLIDGVMVDKKIRINEKRTQVVDTKPSDRNQLNQARLNTPVKVTKTIIMDVDKDSGFDRVAIITYEIKNNEIYNLEIMKKGNSGKIKKDFILLEGEKKEAYLLGDENLAVFGYMNDEDTFVVDYF